MTPQQINKTATKHNSEDILGSVERIMNDFWVIIGNHPEDETGELYKFLMTLGKEMQCIHANAGEIKQRCIDNMRRN